MPDHFTTRLEEWSGQPRSGVARALRLLIPAAFLCGIWIVFRVVNSTPAVAYSSVSPGAERMPELEVAAAPPARAGVERIAHVVKRGDTFSGILTSHGINPLEIRDYYHSLISVGFSLLYPGDSIIIRRAADGGLKRFSLLSRIRCWYEAGAEGDRIRAEKRPVTTAVQIRLARGTLHTSLAEAMWDIDVRDAVASKLADIFAWDINFFIDPREGDRFEVIFEEKYANGRFVGYGDILAARYVNRGNTHYALGLPDAGGRMAYFDREGNSVQKQFLKAPLRYSRISSGYSYRRRHPILGIVRPHLGIDYAAPRGTPVYASADGTVSFAGTKGGYGRMVKLRHGAAYETLYGHLRSIANGVRPGARVRQGQLIGRVGSTGLSTGPHLDYRMKVGSRFVNPLTIKAPSKEGVAPEDRARFEAMRLQCLALWDLRFPGSEEGCFTLHVEYASGEEGARVKYVARSGGGDAGRSGS